VVDVSVARFVAECCQAWPGDRCILSVLHAAHTRWALKQLHGRGLHRLELPTQGAFERAVIAATAAFPFADGDGLRCLSGVALTLEANALYGAVVQPAPPRRVVALKGGLEK